MTLALKARAIPTPWICLPNGWLLRRRKRKWDEGGGDVHLWYWSEDESVSLFVDCRCSGRNSSMKKERKQVSVYLFVHLVYCVRRMCVLPRAHLNIKTRSMFVQSRLLLSPAKYFAEVCLPSGGGRYSLRNKFCKEHMIWERVWTWRRRLWGDMRCHRALFILYCVFIYFF